MLHRDIKPANILLSEANSRGRRILLADFGIAKEIADISGLTATNVVVGTTAYSAPEQPKGADVDGRADQYALVALLLPADRGRAVSKFQCGGGHGPTPVRTAPADRQATAELAELNDVMTKVLAKDPDDGYPTCSDFATTLTGQPAGAERTVAGRPAAAATTRVYRAAAAHGTETTPPRFAAGNGGLRYRHAAAARGGRSCGCRTAAAPRQPAGHRRGPAGGPGSSATAAPP